MLDYGAAAAGRPATEAEWMTYRRNLVSKAVSGRVWTFLHRVQMQIHFMQDGILLASVSRGEIFNMEVFDWAKVTSIDVRADPVRVVIDGKARLVEGVDKVARTDLFDALTSARQCGAVPTHVIIEGRRFKKPRRIWIAVEWMAVLAVLVLLGTHRGLIGGVCKVEAVRVVPDVFIVNGDADAGVTVRAILSNSGRQSAIRVTAVLDTSEGRFTREQKYTLAENAREDLAFGFPEPTINATDVQAHVSCEP